MSIIKNPQYRIRFYCEIEEGELNNLQPMQCYHNRVVKSDNYPWTEDQHWRRFNLLNKK